MNIEKMQQQQQEQLMKRDSMLQEMKEMFNPFKDVFH